MNLVRYLGHQAHDRWAEDHGGVLPFLAIADAMRRHGHTVRHAHLCILDALYPAVEPDHIALREPFAEGPDALDLAGLDVVLFDNFRQRIEQAVLGAAMRIGLDGALGEEVPFAAEFLGDAAGLPALGADEFRIAVFGVVQHRQVAAMASLRHGSSDQRRLHQRADRGVFDGGARRVVRPGLQRIDRRDVAGDAQRVGYHLGALPLDLQHGGRRAEDGAGIAQDLGAFDLAVLDVAQIVHRLSDAVRHLMRQRDGDDHISAGSVAAFGHGQRGGDHVGRHMAGRQDRIVVQRVDQFAIGERRAEHRAAFSGAEKSSLFLGPTHHAPDLDADLTLGLAGRRQGAADGIENQSLALPGRLRAEIFIGAIGGRVRQLFDDCLCHFLGPRKQSALQALAAPAGDPAPGVHCFFLSTILAGLAGKASPGWLCGLLGVAVASIGVSGRLITRLSANRDTWWDRNPSYQLLTGD